MNQVHNSHVSDMPQLQHRIHRNPCGIWIDRGLHDAHYKYWAKIKRFPRDYQTNQQGDLLSPLASPRYTQYVAGIGQLQS